MKSELAGRGVWRGVYSSLVDHPDFQALSPEARLVLFVARLGAANNIASIFRFYPQVLQKQTGLLPEALERALKELETKPNRQRPWVVRDELVLWIRNGLRHDPTTTLENLNHRKAVLRAVSALPGSSSVVKKFRKYYELRLQSPSPSHPGTHAQGDPQSTIPTPTPIPIQKQKTMPERGSGGKPPGAPQHLSNFFDQSSKESYDGYNSSRPRRTYDEIEEGLRCSHPEWPKDQLERAALAECQRQSAR